MLLVTLSNNAATRLKTINNDLFQDKCQLEYASVNIAKSKITKAHLSGRREKMHIDLRIIRAKL